MPDVSRGLGFLPERTLLDGGFGTSLIQRGLDIAAEPTSLWNLERPDQVLSIHRDFADSGAVVLQTNTFGANRLALAGRGGVEVRACNLAAADLARRAAGPSGLVAGSLGPSSLIPPPQGDGNLLAMEEAYCEQAQTLAEGGVDFLHIETMAHPKEMRAALRGVRLGAPSKPVVVSIAARRQTSGFTTTQGFSIASMVQVGCEEGLDGFGVNCMLAPADMVELAALVLDLIEVPVFAQPTCSPDGRNHVGAEEFAESVASLFALGVRAVGGCCGTSADDIACAHRAVFG